jgi:hypothetical protein
MSLPYAYHNRGRRRATGITLAVVWMLLGAAYIWLDAAPLVVLVFAAFTLPALYDLLADPHATFSMDAHHLSWQTPRQDAEIALSEIDHLRFDTRLDMSVRLTVVRPSGIKIRVPFPATPPHAAFEAIALEAGLKTQRHHFSLLG